MEYKFNKVVRKRKLKSYLINLENFIEKLVFPLGIYCVCCGKIIDDSRTYLLCDHCMEHFTWGHIEIDLNEEEKVLKRKSYLDRAWACVNYGVYERRLIFELKYNKKTYMARLIAEIVKDRILSDKKVSDFLSEDMLLIPVPIHRKKEKTRGFNQTAKISKYLGEYLGVETLSRGLLRDKETIAQRSVSGEERYRNLEEAFKVNPVYLERVQGRQILLLDDVYTTGATAHHCGRVLKEAGAKEVVFMALASGNDFAKGYETPLILREK